MDLPPWAFRVKEEADRKKEKAAEEALASQAKPAPKRKAAEPLGEGKLRLRSDEHVTGKLANRLKRGQRKDEEEMDRVIAQAESIGSVAELAEQGIKPLMVMADSRYTEIQRDAAAALYSLAISEKNQARVACVWQPACGSLRVAARA
jgi:hypothetical protein